jgi:transcriptional regulator with XRE-family HTH domain
MTDFAYTPMAIWGRELRHYRKAAGLTQIELAAKIKYSPSLVSQIETGQVPATPDFATTCNETLDTGGALVRLLDYRKGDIPPWCAEWMPYEEGAGVLKTFQPRLVYGLLQTEGYTRTVLAGDEMAIGRRLARQRIFERSEPPTLHVVLDESVLWRDVGGPEAMRAQLSHLVAMLAKGADPNPAEWRPPGNARAVRTRYAGERQYSRIPGDGRPWIDCHFSRGPRTSGRRMGSDQGRCAAGRNVQGTDRADGGGTMDALTTPWRKSTRTGGNNDDCVEIAVVETGRD